VVVLEDAVVACRGLLCSLDSLYILFLSPRLDSASSSSYELQHTDTIPILPTDCC
jgi:hypothetical protein